MNAVTWMLLLLLMGASAYVLVFRIGARAWRRKHNSRHGAASFSGMNKPPLRVYKYRAVELQLCDDPCESALGIAGKRLLKSEAPALPLARCPHKKCMCTYIQYDDRRFMQRRSGSYPYGIPMGGPGRLKEERRKNPGDRRARGFDQR